MSKPDWCPQSVWDSADGSLNPSVVRLNAKTMNYLVESISRAILSAVIAEREECAEAGFHATEQFVRYKIGSEWSDEAGNAVEVSIRNRP